MSAIDGTRFSTIGTHTSDSLTNAFVLHPVACGLAFIAAICALGGVIGGLIGTIIAVIAWLITIVVMVIDFVVFGVSFSHSYSRPAPYSIPHCSAPETTDTRDL